MGLAFTRFRTARSAASALEFRGTTHLHFEAVAAGGPHELLGFLDGPPGQGVVPPQHRPPGGARVRLVVEALAPQLGGGPLDHLLGVLRLDEVRQQDRAGRLAKQDRFAQVLVRLRREELLVGHGVPRAHVLLGVPDESAGSLRVAKGDGHASLRPTENPQG
eukprot:3491065-Pyramimonas_sp.AAC.1